MLFKSLLCLAGDVVENELMSSLFCFMSQPSSTYARPASLVIV